MLTANPTKKGIGIEIWGDYNDLECLYDVMSVLSLSKSATNEADFERNERLLTIVPYEIRHAFQGERLKNKHIGNGHSCETLYYGFRTDWITILFTYSALRFNAAHTQTDAFIQGWLYLLEFQIKNAIYMYDELGAIAIEPLIEQGLNVSTKYVYLLHQNYVAKYLSMKSGKKRFRSIPLLLTDKAFEKEIINSIDECMILENCPISEIKSTSEMHYPDIW